MSISKVNPPGWGVGDKLTAAQANDLDANTTYALDKRTGQTDTLASTCTITGALTCTTTGSFTFATGTSCTIASGATCSLAGAATVASGGSLTVASGGTLAVASGSTFTCNTTVSLGASGAIGYATPRVVTRIVSAAHVALGLGAGGSGAWTYYYTGTTRFGMTSDAVASNLIIPIRAPIHGATLTSVDFLYYLTGGARTPATNRLQFSLWRASISSMGAPVSLFATSSQQVSAYTSFATLLSENFAPDQNNVIDAYTYEYWLVVKEEDGAGGISGNTVRGFKLNYTVATLPNA